MIYHYPKWLIGTCVFLVFLGLYGSIRQGMWQIAAYALASTIMMGIMIQTQIWLVDEQRRANGERSIIRSDVDRCVERLDSWDERFKGEVRPDGSGIIPIRPDVIPPGVP